MERIGNYLITLDDVIHVLPDADGTFVIITKSIGPLAGLNFTEDQYEQLVAELGVAEPEEYPHTDVVYEDGHFVTEPNRE